MAARKFAIRKVELSNNTKDSYVYHREGWKMSIANRNRQKTFEVIFAAV